MAKHGFYGVYGVNGAGIYDNWNEVLNSKQYIQGFKDKKFSCKEDAIEYVMDGLINEYGVLRLGEIQTEKFYQRRNWFWWLDDLQQPLEAVSASAGYPFYIATGHY